MIVTSHSLRDNTVDQIQNLKISESCSNSEKACPQGPKAGNKTKGGKVALKCPKGMRDYTPDQVANESCTAN